MYKKIETLYKKESDYYKDNTIIVTSYILSIAISLLAASLFNKWYFQILSIAFAVIVSVILYYCYIFKKITKDKKRSFFSFKQNFMIYNKIIQKNDVKKMRFLLKKANVDTYDKLKEVIRHYQTLTERNLKKSNNFMSIISFVISIVTIIITDYLDINYYYLGLIIVLICLVTIFYITIISILNVINLMFNQIQLYSRIESACAEIYMKNILK